jgi:hypothetical protein
MRPEKARAGTGPSSVPGAVTRLAAEGRGLTEGAAFAELRAGFAAASDAAACLVVGRGAVLAWPADSTRRVDGWDAAEEVPVRVARGTDGRRVAMGLPSNVSGGHGLVQP